MRGKPGRKLFFEFPFIIILAVFLLGFVVMLLWNAILPQVLHTEKITYWQAVGLFILSRILFFGFGRRGGFKDRRPGMWRGGGPYWRQKWMHMSDEERAKFREEWKRRRCSPGRNNNDN